MEQVALAVLDIRRRCDGLIEEQCYPDIEEAHKVADHAFKLLNDRIAGMSVPLRNALLYTLYEELLIKAAELQTVADLMTNRCPQQPQRVSERVERHMDRMLA